jgi:heme/copper-type cytochrome/quinol oxidase subunit 2
MATILLLLGVYLWAGFSAWILMSEEDPSSRTPKWLLVALVIWWAIPFIALFNPDEF